jgi:putative holliday junction resolvase
MRILGIDLGLKRTGLAMSDETGIAIRALPNLYAKSQLNALEKILSLVKEFTIEIIVIGCPEPKTTGSIAIASRAHTFKEKLEDILKSDDKPTLVVIRDEAMTSKRAMAQLVKADVPQKKRKLLLDGAAAALLVEDFLAERERK